MKHVPRKIKDKYEILGIIGEGAYGVVLKAQRRDTKAIVAIKQFKQAPGYLSDNDLIDRELKILQALRFENVVELLEWFREKKHCFLVFEYVEYNMLQILQQYTEGLTIEQVRQLSYQLYNAIHWCHIHEIIHRDIKPENLLISKNFVLKLCDFGFARFCNTQTSADYYTGYVATRWYRAPELLIGTSYGKPADIWACGCIMAELATGQALFAGESDIDQLYRIQKCLGPLPSKYVEAMKSNPKFDGLKFPFIHQLETLDRRFGRIFPPDIMHLFKQTLRVYALDRLTAEKCLQHDAFHCLNQKRLHRSYRPKSLHSSLSTSQLDPNLENIYHSNPFIDHRLSKSFDETDDYHVRHRSSDNSTDISQIKYRSTNQLNHQPKIFRAQSRTHSSSSTEQTQPSSFLSPRSSNETSDNEDEQINVRLRRKYLKTSQQQLPSSTTLKYASNGVLLRTKQQPTHPINLLPTTSNDMSKKFKRFSLEQQIIQIPDGNYSRSSMAVVPNHVSNSFKQIHEESIVEAQQQQPTTKISFKEITRNRTPDRIASPQRVSSRQSFVQSHQIVPDLADQSDVNSMSSFSISTNNRFCEPRKSMYASDSYLINSHGHSSTFTRPFYSPPKNDHHRVIITPHREPISEPVKTIKSSLKQSFSLQTKTPIESNRIKSQSSSNSFSIYPLARTAILHVAQTLIPSSNQRQQSVRYIQTKTRHNDK